MAQTLTLNHGYSGAGGGQTKNVQKTSDAIAAYDITVAIGATNFEAVVGIDISELEAIYINASQDLLMETNDGTTPDDQFNLVADTPLVWFNGGYFANPFGADVTSLFFTNASGVEATVTIRIVQDATP